jgi:hypothetical protein
MPSSESACQIKKPSTLKWIIVNGFDTWQVLSDDGMVMPKHVK